MLPDFVVLGAQKSASSFVQECLAEHPAIYMPAGETAFFESPDYERGSLRDLERLFAGRPQPVLGIKRPNYLARPEVPARIGRDLPQARLIAVLRHPVDRAVSAYYHNINYGFLPAIEPEVGLRLLLQGGTLLRRYPRAAEILEFGFYHKHLLRYRDFLNRGQLLVLLHDDVVAAPLEAVRRIYRFLGVDPDYTPACLHSRPQAVVYHRRRLRFLRLRRELLFRYNVDRTRMEMSADPMRNRIATLLLRIDRRVLAPLLGNEKPRLSVALREALQALYDEDIDALQELLGRDLSAWRLSAAAPSKTATGGAAG